MKRKMIAIRFLSLNHYDFIQEHRNVMETYNHVWMLKTGKYIPSSVMGDVLTQGGIIILKAPKSVGGKYYRAHYSEFLQGIPNKGMVYPKYYRSIPENYEKDKLDGTWMKIDSIEDVDEDYVSHLRLYSNDKLLSDVIGQTRTSVMYVYSDEDVSI